MTKVEVLREGPGFMEAKIDMSKKLDQEVVRVGDARLRQPSMHTLGDRINYSEAGPEAWNRDLIVLPVPMGELFDVEVFERTRIRLIPKTSLAASLLWDWIASEPRMACGGINAQSTGKDDTRWLEITFAPRVKVEPPATPAKVKAKRRRKS